VNATPSHLTLREWRRRMAHPVALSVMGAVAAVLAVIAPFESGRHLGALARLAYWAAIVSGTYGTGLAVALALGPRLEGRVPLWAVVLLQGVATGLAIIPVIFVLTLAFFPGLPPLGALISLAAQGVVIAVVVTAVIAVVSAHLAPENTQPRQPPLLARLPLERRGAILSLSAEDHYTRVRTTAGEALVLIRLSDAITLAAPIAGVQIHRSHWVAVAAVVSVRRQGDGAVVRLKDETELPASRRNIPALRDAGLLAG
jgi:hypothetical protein